MERGYTLHGRTTAHRLWVSCFIAFVAVSVWSTSALAFPQYSIDRDPTNCRACHGDFRDGNYISNTDGQNWGNDLHDIHRRDMLESSCSACHLGSNGPPVFMGLSDGTSDLAPFGCAGCHVTSTGTRRYLTRLDSTRNIPRINLPVCASWPQKRHFDMIRYVPDEIRTKPTLRPWTEFAWGLRVIDR